MDVPHSIISYDTPFSRSIGLSRAVQHVAELAAKKSLENPKVFVVDTSMLLPEDFIERLHMRILCGQMVFAPIAYKLREEIPTSGLPNRETLATRQRLNEGLWVYTGFGMIGFCLKDYLKVGGYNESWGYAWGAEDVDLADRFQNAGFNVYHSHESHYYHKAWKNVSAFLNIKRNSYPSPAIDIVRTIYQAIKSDKENDHDFDNLQHQRFTNLQMIDPHESLSRWKQIQSVLHQTYGNDLMDNYSINRITAFFGPNKKEYLLVDMVGSHDNVITLPRVERIYLIENQLRPIALAIHGHPIGDT